MRIFISWSGHRSGKVAGHLLQWLPKVIQFVRPWVSSSSIDPGTRWSIEIGQALEENHFGILCLTPENLTAPWILFEAGALSKAVSHARIIPYLLGFDPRELQGPLAQFQAVQADRTGTLQLLVSLNTAAAEPLDALEETFDLWWPRLEPQLQEIAAAAPIEVVSPARSVDDMLGEVLSLFRAQQRVMPQPAKSLMDGDPPNFNLSQNQEELTKYLIHRALTTFKSYTEAAMALGIDRRTLWKFSKKYPPQ
jgi:hypothetical protein